MGPKTNYVFPLWSVAKGNPIAARFARNVFFGLGWADYNFQSKPRSVTNGLGFWIYGNHYRKASQGFLFGLLQSIGRDIDCVT